MYSVCWLITGSSNRKPGLQYLETAGRWPSAAHAPPLAGWASLVPPGTSPKAPAAPECVPLQRTQRIVKVCAHAASLITEQSPSGGCYPVFNMNISFCMLKLSLEEIFSFFFSPRVLSFLGFVHSEPLTESFLSSENSNQNKSIIHFLMGTFLHKAAYRYCIFIYSPRKYN